MKLPVADFFSVPPPWQIGPVAYAAAPACHTVSVGVFVALARGQGIGFGMAWEAAVAAACHGCTLRVGRLLLRVDVGEGTVC